MRISSLILVVAAVGCGKEGGGYKPTPVAKVAPVTIAEGSEQDLFPLVVGNQWVYNMEFSVEATNQQPQQGQGDLTFRVSSVVNEPDGSKKATIDILTAGKLNERQVWRTNKKGLFQITTGQIANQVTYTPAQPAILFPVTPGKTFTWSGSGAYPGGGKGTSNSRGVILGSREVDTDMGRMSAIAVESDQSWTTDKGVKGRAASTIWFAPQVGIVRFRQEIAAGNVTAVQKLTLKSKSLKE